MFQFFVFSAHFPYNQTEETNKRENTTSMLWLIGKIKKIKLQLKNTQRLWIFNFPKPFGPIQNRNLHSSSSLSIFILQPKQQRPKEFLPPLSFPSILSGTKRQRFLRFWVWVRIKINKSESTPTQIEMCTLRTVASLRCFSPHLSPVDPSFLYNEGGEINTFQDFSFFYFFIFLFFKNFY